VRELGREKGGVLSGAGADLEHAPRIAQHPLQHREDRGPVSLGGLGKWLHSLRNRQVQIGPSSAPMPSVTHAMPQD